MAEPATPPIGPESRAGARSLGKRRAILDAATGVFLRSGYSGSSVDEIVAVSGVSKPTLYKQFASKEALFVEAVVCMTTAASDAVHEVVPDPGAADEVADYLEEYGFRQLTVVLTPKMLQLRRMVIGEAGRFPGLGQALYESGPGRAIKSIAAALARLSKRGFLDIEDAAAAAAQFNWLVMGEPLNAAMFLGDDAVPDRASLRGHAAAAARVFLAAYGVSDQREQARRQESPG